MCAKLSAHASVHRSKLEDRVSNASNRLITQRLCLLLAAMAAADGAEAGAVLVNHAVQLKTGSTNGNQVLKPLLQAACTLFPNHNASLSSLFLTLVAIPVAAISKQHATHVAETAFMLFTSIVPSWGLFSLGN